MSLSLLACSRMPRCSVHTANVFGVCEWESQRLVLHSVGCGEWGWLPVPYLEHGLLVLTVLHLGLGEVEDGPLDRILVRVVDIDVWAPDHHEAFHPSVGVRLQEVQVALFGDDGTAEGIKVRGGIQTVRRWQW